jgi:hypothetical protein
VSGGEQSPPPLPDVSATIYEIARAGRMVVFPAMEPFRPILVDAHQRQDLPRETVWEEPFLCTTAQDLHGVLERGFAAFSGYRDKAVRGD